MPVPCANYTTVGELAAHAFKQLERAFGRSDQQEIDWWLRVYLWAKDMNTNVSPQAYMALCWGEIQSIRSQPGWAHRAADVAAVADLHMQMVYCRNMAAHQGKSLTKPSLNWLNEVLDV